MKGEKVVNQRKQPGTPNRQVQSARNGVEATHSVTRSYRTLAEIERENRMRTFKIGLAIGFIASALIFAVILFLWVIPTMDAAVATAQEMVA